MQQSTIDVLNVFDLGYLDVEKDFSEQPCRSYRSERKEIWNYLKKKIEYNKSHSRRKKLVIEHTICRLKSIGYLQMYLEIN